MTFLHDLALYAYVGYDELGSGEIGLKQARTPAGMIPLASVNEEQLRQEYIIEQLDAMATRFGTDIHLARFVYAESRLILP